MLPKPFRLRHCGQYFIGRASSRLMNLRDRWLDAPPVSFFDAMCARAFDPDAHIDALPRHRLIYVSVPKCASTTIKPALSALELGLAPAPDKLHTRRYSGLRSPTQIGLSAFHRLATSAATLRFAFVRNPYARLVSAWADKFQDKPLVPGDSFVDLYWRIARRLKLGCRTGRTKPSRSRNSWSLRSHPAAAASIRTGKRRTICSTCPG